MVSGAWYIVYVVGLFKSYIPNRTETYVGRNSKRILGNFRETFLNTFLQLLLVALERPGD